MHTVLCSPFYKVYVELKALSHIRTEGVERMPSMTFSPLISKGGGGESIEIG